MKTFDSRSATNLARVHPKLVAVMQRALDLSPIPFIVIYGLRTAEEQAAYYAQGRSKAGAIVTNCDGIKKRSNHQSRIDGYAWAVDVLVDANRNSKVDPCEIQDINGLKQLAPYVKQAAKEIGVKVEWGGDWKMRDYPHFELTGI